MYTPLSDDDVLTMTVPLWEQAKDAMVDNGYLVLREQAPPHG